MFYPLPNSIHLYYEGCEHSGERKKKPDTTGWKPSTVRWSHSHVFCRRINEYRLSSCPRHFIHIVYKERRSGAIYVNIIWIHDLFLFLILLDWFPDGQRKGRCKKPVDDAFWLKSADTRSHDSMVWTEGIFPRYSGHYTLMGQSISIYMGSLK